MVDLTSFWIDGSKILMHFYVDAERINNLLKGQIIPFQLNPLQSSEIF